MDDTLSHLTGGCLCGAVRYETSAPPLAMGFCHCRTCQRATGSGYMPWVLMQADHVKVTGDYKEYQSIGESGKPVYRGFCTECGSRVFFRGDVMPGLCTVSAASLDHPSLFKPQMHLWTEDAQPWDCMSDECPKLPRGPQQ
ncbi:MAG: GFA family protein [Gammaproteobacteria bacterium]